MPLYRHRHTDKDHHARRAEGLDAIDGTLVQPGDWLVTVDGRVVVLDEEAFTDEYIPLNTEAASYLYGGW